jgi:hypothetical protein
MMVALASPSLLLASLTSPLTVVCAQIVLEQKKIKMMLSTKDLDRYFMLKTEIVSE